jgi:uncharacterized protein (TIGR03086 family)
MGCDHNPRPWLRQATNTPNQIGHNVSYYPEYRCPMTDLQELPDPRPLLFRSLDQAALVVRAVSADQHCLPTPCTEFDVKALLTHIVGVCNRVAGAGRGEPQAGAAQVPAGSEGLLADICDDLSAEARAVWADDAVLDRKVSLPFGTFDGATVAAIYTMELTAHAWDLARATGRVGILDDELALASLAVAHFALPVDQRGGPIPFDAVVAVADDASPYDRLAAYLGRGVD